MHESASATSAPVSDVKTTTRRPSRAAAREARPREELFLNRELSWLDFNARVLAEALSERNPLLERLKFLGIFSNNLDEFFMIHVPGMRQRIAEAPDGSASERNAAAMLDAIHQKLEPMLHDQYRCLQEIVPELGRFNVRLLSYAELDDAQRERIAHYFDSEIFPVLTPLAVDPGHPFPYISNLSISLAVVVRDPITGGDRFARVKVPARAVLPRLVPVGDGWQYVLLEEVISAHMDRLFVGMVIQACYPFRVTRDADLELQEESADDLLELIEEELSKRRFGEIVRLEMARSMPASIQALIMEELDASPADTYLVDGPLNMADFLPLASIDIPELRDPPFVPSVPSVLRSGDIFAAIRGQDIMLHHPYQAFSCVSEFLRRAAEDPHVLAIKHTLYRTSGDSPILESLIEAADSGKQVACVVELKARFDEANNINWARQLEKSGVHVVYGMVGLKTHCKVTIVVRREDDGIRRYLHVGTGNYNPRTATVYTDLGLLTCDPEFAADASDLFNYLTGYSHQDRYRQFLVAPVTARKRLRTMIEREAAQSNGHPGRIIAKMNSLVDPDLILCLYNASSQGVQIDLIIRGMCCLRPGVPGLSDNIRVVSVIGRFLEHSRIFYFANGGSEELYFGSADWMPRNLDRRVEVIAPVRDPDIRKNLRENVLELMLKDNCQAWDLQPDGEYIRRSPKAGQRRFNAQDALLRAAAQ